MPCYASAYVCIWENKRYILKRSIDPNGLRPRLYEEKLSRVEGSPAYPSYPGRANFSYISLQNLANRLHEKQKVGSARRVTRLAGSPFCDGRVTLLAGPTFLHINTLARSAGRTSRKLKSVFYLKEAKSESTVTGVSDEKQKRKKSSSGERDIEVMNY